MDLGRGVWCTWELEDPTAKVNLNQADRQVLMTLLASDSLVDAIMDWRDADDLPLEFGAELGWYSAHGRLVPRNGPFAAVEELGLVRGFDSTRLAEARERFTVRGTGAINPNLAPVEILATIPELGPEALEVIRGRRAQDRPLGSLDELLSLLSPAGRAPILARYPELLGRLAFGPAQLVARVTGGVRGYPLTSTAVLTVVPLPDRLAVVRRETE